MEHRPEDRAGLGARLRELRERKGLHLHELAGGGLSADGVARVEDGGRLPAPAVLRTLADLVGCSVEYLRTGRDEAGARELELKIAFGDLAIRNGDNGEALRSYSEALAAAPFLTEEQVRQARAGQALAFEKLGRLAAAVQLYTELFEDGRTVPGSAQWSRLAVALCRCHAAAGDPVLAVETGERAMSTLDALGVELTDDHMQLGSTLMGCYQNRGDLPRAQLLAERLIKVAEGSGSRVARGVVYWNAGIVASAQGRVQEALGLTEQAVAMLAEGDNLRHQALVKSVYAFMLLESEPPDPLRAKAILAEAHPVVLEVGTALERGKSEELLAQASFQLGDAAAAIRHARRAVEQLRDTAPAEEAAARVLLARAQYQSGDAGEAQATLQQAVRRLGPLPSTRTTTKAWRKAGDLWKLLGRPAEALAAYERALAQLREGAGEA
ncbi:helix-turn-helix transcriptional regulator [Kitasatospora sp. NPDC002227]|uniref:helix-turn-helix transcriptional regulator n=1 Tax=Kitasatospora sp. NPDC002227 TaxID=3154773 RepID=UPI0033283C83